MAKKKDPAQEDHATGGRLEGDARAAGEALQGTSGGNVGGPAPGDEAGGGTVTGGPGKPLERRRDVDATDEWDEGAQ